MFNKTITSSFEHLYHVSGVPFLIADTKGNILQSYPERLKDFYCADYWSTMPGNLSSSKHPEGTTLICVGEMYYVAIIKLDKDHYFATVPLSSAQNKAPSFFPALQNGIHPDHMADFYRFLSELPSFCNIRLSETASLAKLLYCGKAADGINLMYLSDRENIMQEVTLKDTLTRVSPSYEGTMPVKHVSSSYAKNVKEAITNGDISLLNVAIRRPMYGSIGRMSLNDLRQAKYEFICVMYDCCRAAIDGGLAPEYSYQLSDFFCQKMDGMTRADEIRFYSRECMRQFCEKVAESKSSTSYSSYTTSCCEYIHQHLLDPLDVDILSHAVGLNRRSLARYFIEDTGITILQYITEKRLNESAYLLINSDLALSDISNLLQFSSQSQFTEKFKIKYGLTPAQYRKEGRILPNK